MKYFLPLILILFVACNKTDSVNKPDVKTPENTDDKISYTIGYELGTSFRIDSLKINNEFLLRGLMDGMADDTTEALALMKKEERQKTSMELSENVQKRKQAEQDAALQEFRSQGNDYKASGEKYLAENGKKPGVITLPSGIQYKIMKDAKGKKPSVKSTVKMHLVAKFTDGKIFDNTYAEGRGPVDLPVEQLIPGWKEIIPLMPVGAKWEVTIPYQMAYGEPGYQTTIPPFATLIFEMELLEIVK